MIVVHWVFFCSPSVPFFSPLFLSPLFSSFLFHLLYILDFQGFVFLIYSLFFPLLIWKFCPLFLCVLSNLSGSSTESKVHWCLSLPNSTRILEHFDASHHVINILLCPGSHFYFYFFLALQIGHYSHCFTWSSFS